MDSTVTVTMPSEGEFAPAKSMLELAEGYSISSPLMYRSAADDLKAVKKLAADLEAREKTITRPLLEATKAVRDLFREPRAWLDRAEARLKSCMISYDQAEEAARREAQARADFQARAERDRLAHESARLATEGKLEEAEAVAAVAGVVSAPIVETERPKVDGVKYRDKYDAEVVDMGTFLAHVVAAPALHYLVEVNTTNLRKLAEAQKDAFTLPGAKLVKSRVVASSR